MKIQCDVCKKEEAIIFCPSDEAALCQACDHDVHHANKLARKHHRFDLQCHSSKDCPLCDICQERQALLFCKEDRAILCIECDGTIHQANEFTKKHNRFLLTCVKLSAMASTYQASSASTTTTTTPTSTSMKNDELWRATSHVMTPESSLNYREVDSHCYGMSEMAQASSSMETLAGWSFDDFLDASPSPYGFYKMLPIVPIEPINQVQILYPVPREWSQAGSFEFLGSQ